MIEDFYWAWRASEYRLLPGQGNWLDQDPTFWKDVMQYHEWYAYKESMLKWNRKSAAARKALLKPVPGEVRMPTDGA